METTSPRHLTCVLADDHETVRSVIRRRLELLGWIDVVSEVEHGDGAVEAIAEHVPDVAIVDVRMPDVTGFDVCSRVRERGLPTRVVLYSALAGPENVDLGLKLGAAAFVSKDDGFGPLHEALLRIASA